MHLKDAMYTESIIRFRSEGIKASISLKIIHKVYRFMECLGQVNHQCSEVTAVIYGGLVSKKF